MIELLIGVPLTIAAWKRGWKGWALLPLPAYFVGCYLAGIVWGAIAGPGITEADLESTGSLICWGLLAITVVILVAMIIKAKRCSTGSELHKVTSIEPVKMFCPKCGKEQEDNPNFCRGCGENLALKSRYGCA